MNEYEALWHKEGQLHQKGYLRIAGIDEAGRGPLAGPVVAAAVVFPPALRMEGLRDSKKLTEKKRWSLEVQIKELALDWHIGQSSVEEINSMNILEAARLAMMRAVEGLKHRPDHLLIDALTLPLDIPQEGIIRGDDLVACISAASILAKNHRDRLMVALDEVYPDYAFGRHKGYGTQLHRDRLLSFGPCPEHRQLFIRNLFNQKKGGNHANLST